MTFLLLFITSYLFVSVFERQRRPRHLLHKVLPVFLLLVRGDEDDLQLVLVLGALLEAAVEVAQAAVELLAGAVQAAAEEQPDQGQPGAQGLHVHLGFLAVDEPLPEQTHQKLRRHRSPQSSNARREKALSRGCCCSCNRRYPARTHFLPSVLHLRFEALGELQPRRGEARRCRCGVSHRGASSGVSAVQECAPLKSA